MKKPLSPLFSNGKKDFESPYSGAVVALILRHALEAPMSSAKTEAKSMIDGLPEDTSLEDIQYHLYVLEKVKRGLERAETEGTIAHEDAKARLGKWLAS